MNLYGHPQAQTYWHTHVNKIMLAEGFVPVTGWECVYVHHEKKLFVSVYVDDFKLAGLKKNLRPMIKVLSAKVDLADAMPLHGDVYLGCKQENIAPPLELLKQKSDLYNMIVKDDIPDPDILWLGNADNIKAWQYDMTGHVKQTVER